MTAIHIYGKMDPEKKAVWVTALRSGEYLQLKHHLHSNHNKFCCLGVNLKVIEGWTPDPLYCFKEAHGLNTQYWQEALFAQGLSAVAVDTLARMNDAGSTFDQIADWIDTNL